VASAPHCKDQSQASWGLIKLVLGWNIHLHPQITLWLFNIAMENGPSIDGLPIKNGDFPWLC
jgi:hypothetical protein